MAADNKALATDDINRTLGLSLKLGKARMSAAVHEKIATKHASDHVSAAGPSLSPYPDAIPDLLGALRPSPLKEMGFPAGYGHPA